MALPAALAALGHYRQFIACKLVPTNTGKMDKIPCDYRNGLTGVDAHDPQYHADYDTIAASGFPVAFVLTDNDPFFCLDIDNCLQADGQWTPTALAVINDFPGAAVEVSQSGKGLHIWGCYTQIPPHKSKNTQLGIELYHHKRFILLGQPNATGEVWQDFTQHLTAGIVRYFPGNESATGAEWRDGPVSEWNGPTDDDELIRRALRSGVTKAFGSGARFIDLWECNEEVLARAYPATGEDTFDRSSADAALAAHLRFWTGGDCERMRRLMLRSGLLRDKYEREDYLPRTILAVCSMGGDVLQDAGGAAAEGVLVNRNDGNGVLGIQARQGTGYMTVTEQVSYFGGCVYIADIKRVLDRNGVLFDKENFRAFYSGHIFYLDNLNEKTTDDPWKVFESSRALSFPRVHTSWFKPELPTGHIDTTSTSLTRVNTYRPAQIRRTPGDPSPFLDLIRRMLPVEWDRQVILAYLAALVQYPGIKFQYCPLIQGVEGNGKTTINKVMWECVGSDYCYSVRASTMSKNFNGWLPRRILITVEDVYFDDSEKDIIEVLKPMITGNMQEIEFKGVDQGMVDVCANFILNTNHKAALRKTRNDRRFAPFYTAQQEVADLERDGMTHQYFKNLRRWLEKEDGYAIMAHYFHTYEIPDALNPAFGIRAPNTSSTEEAIREGMGVIEQEIVECIEQERHGFAGGWISSFAVDHLIDSKRLNVPRRHRKGVLYNLGYEWHPALPNGRSTVSISELGLSGRPILYLKKGHISMNLTGATEASRAYIEAQAKAAKPSVVPAFSVGA